MMRSRDLDVIDVGTGEEAIVVASGGGADVIILDLGLPDIDGLEVLRRVRTFSDVPVIVLTAHHHQAEKILALDAGADDYVTKPFDPEELLARSARPSAGRRTPRLRRRSCAPKTSRSTWDAAAPSRSARAPHPYRAVAARAARPEPRQAADPGAAAA
jgi:DNA-binding response OmpR family regulator